MGLRRCHTLLDGNQPLVRHSFIPRVFPFAISVSFRRQDEIFDLVADPSESNNLAHMPEYADVAAFLNDTLKSWVEVSYPLLKYPTLVDRASELLEVSQVPAFSF